MKRETAIKYAREIARRAQSVNGLLATPGCSYEAVRIKRMWIFGSTVKGKTDPNDLDLLIEMSGVDDASNIHILCGVCHKDSEYLDGGRYLAWLISRTPLDMIMSASAKRGINLSQFLGSANG